MLSDSAKHTIRRALANAPHGSKRSEAERLAALYGCSVSTVYRAASVGGAKRPRKPKMPAYRRAVRIAVDLAHRAPAPAPLDLALEAAVGAGLIAAGDVPPLSTAHRIVRDEGLRPKPRRTQRLCADYPMQAVQVDGTTSKFLSVGDPVGDGDYELRLVKRISARGYKNKPLAAHRLRLQAYGLWDMCTGYVRSVLTVARGENALDQTEALCAMLAETGDPLRPMHGLPDHVWSDNGAWCKSPAVIDLLDRLGVDLVRGAPYNSERQGGAAWVALTNGRPADNRLRRLPKGAIETMSREVRRRVDRNGIVRWDGAEYEVPGWHLCWVIARRPAADGKAGAEIVVELEGTGERRVARAWEPHPYGFVRAIPATPLAVLRAEAPAGGAGADVYAERAAAPGVARLPARSQAAAPLADPLDIDGRCADMAEAMTLFVSIYGRPLSGRAREDLAAEFAAADLCRRAVADIAAEFAALDAEAG